MPHWACIVVSLCELFCALILWLSSLVLAVANHREPQQRVLCAVQSDG